MHTSGKYKTSQEIGKMRINTYFIFLLLQTKMISYLFPINIYFLIIPKLNSQITLCYKTNKLLLKYDYNSGIFFTWKNC